MSTPSKRRAWIARGFVFAALTAAAAWYAGERYLGPEIPALHPERMDIVQTVVATGRIATPARVEIGASITGVVASVNARDGQSVRAGEVLFTIDDREARAALAQTFAGLEEARARIEQLSAVTARIAEQNVQQAAANMHLAEREMRRTQELFAKRFVSEARVDEAARTLELARAQHASSKTQAAATRPDGADYRLAKSGLESAQAAHKLAQARHQLTVVRTPADGTIVRRDVEPGNIVSAGRAVIELARAGATQIIAQVDEKNLALLQIGQEALAAADAYPRDRFAAEIYYINPGIDAQRGTVEIKLRVLQPPAFLLPDMTVSAEIKVAAKRAALTLPSTYIRDLATQPWVLKAVAGKTVRAPVVIGVRGAKRVEILEGVEADEAVLQPDINLGVAQSVRPVLNSTAR